MQAQEPCALARDAAAAFTRNHGLVLNPVIDATLAQACLKSIPFFQEPALDLLNSMKAYTEIQSTVDHLKSPPEGYLYEAVDIPSQLDTIEAKILANNYTSEYDFQLDLRATLIMAKDGHFYLQSDVLTLFYWQRAGLRLVSISADGTSIPQIFNLADLVATLRGGFQAINATDISPVVKVNDIEVSRFIQAESYSDSQQDPDAAWNNQFFSVQKAGQSNGRFNSPVFYPGETTSLTYANGSVQNVVNTAIVGFPLGNITSGSDIYRYWLNVNTGSASTVDGGDPIKRTLNRRQSQSNSTGTRRLPYYPSPVVIDPSGSVSGYFLEAEGFEDVAILAIYGFAPSNERNAGDDYMPVFQSTVQEFLAAASGAGKTKLILDLQGNGGGYIDLALDSYMQLFPQSDGPNSRNTMRASPGLKVMMKEAARIVEDAQSLNETTETNIEAWANPFAFQVVMMPNKTAFAHESCYYGPHNDSRALVTSEMQPNWTNNEPTELGLGGITITGTNDRTDFAQYFQAEDIVILTDGHCASACTIFSELLKNYQQVKSFALGGRPQLGPMQAVGGVKGSQAFNTAVIERMIYLLGQSSDEQLQSLQGTVFENFNGIPMMRSNGKACVNGRNAYRIGDETNTALQFVYEASDCRLFNDLSMATNPVAIWNKVAMAAFGDEGQAESLCVADSTRHPTSVSGGLAQGDIGPQTPPDGAKALPGWLVDGTTIVTGKGIDVFTT